MFIFVYVYVYMYMYINTHTIWMHLRVSELVETKKNFPNYFQPWLFSRESSKTLYLIINT